MNRFIALLTLSVLFSLSSNAQTKLFNSGDKVVVQISNTYGKVYVHEMSPKQTVYTLAKTFDQRMQDVEAVNPGINFDAMKVGQKIRVPFLAASIVKNPADLIKGGEYVYVYYKVRAKDNLYRIAKVYFDTSIENLMAINKTSNFDLKTDQLIKVGWMPIGNTPMTYPQSDNKTSTIVQSAAVVTAPPAQEEVASATPSPVKKAAKSTTSRRTKREKPKKKGFFAKVFGKKNKKKVREDKSIQDVVQLSEQLEERPTQEEVATPAPVQASPQMPAEETERATFETMIDVPEENIDIEEINTTPTEPTYRFKSEKGIAIWNQTSTNSKNMFALHPTATVGSYIEITNPMLNKTVQAKVIGNIPPRTYTDDVSIVVSPRVAKMLGVVDRRFAVHVKYRE